MLLRIDPENLPKVWGYTITFRSSNESYQYLYASQRSRNQAVRAHLAGFFDEDEDRPESIAGMIDKVGDTCDVRLFSAYIHP